MGLDQNKLQEWYKIQQQIDELKADELRLRKEIFESVFTSPVEGSAKNKFDLGDGWVLQGDYKINRKIDEAVISTLAKSDNAGPLVGKVFEYAPKLKLREWKGLTPEDRVLLADAVTETPGTPGLKIVKPQR